jgi:hypothetical protein
MKNLPSLFNGQPTRECVIGKSVIGKSELNDKLVYCVKWDGCKTARGHVIDEKY